MDVKEIVMALCKLLSQHSQEGNNKNQNNHQSQRPESQSRYTLNSCTNTSQNHCHTYYTPV